MPVLEVDRLHARYLRADPHSVGAFDRALRALADDALERELVDVGLPTAHAVCVRQLDVRVALDPSQPTASVARAWAGAVAAALQDRLDAGDGIVVYRRPIDLLVDVVRSVARSDRSRVWAWHQTRALDARVAWPRSGHVAALLAAHPTAAPAAVRAAPAEAAAVLDGDGWCEVARAVRASVGVGAIRTGGDSQPVQGAPHRTHGRDGTGVRHAPSRSGDRRLESQVVDRARGVVPEGVWTRARTDQRIDLAVLALSCLAPSRSRDTVLIDRVAAASTAPDPGTGTPSERRTTTTPARRSLDPAPPDARRLEAPGADRADARRAPAGTSPADAASPALGDLSDAEAVVSEVGGVLFLVHAITALDIGVEVPAWDELARVVAAASGAAADDPAVLVTAGAPADPQLDLLAAPIDDERSAALDGFARLVQTWIRERLDDDGDLAWVWHRRATIEVEGGWVEAVFALGDVDLRLRRAGLDLDPGFVWWLGQVVRFRCA